MGEARTGYISADVVTENPNPTVREARTGYVSADVVTENPNPTEHAARVSYESVETISQNPQDQVPVHEPRVSFESIEVISSNPQDQVPVHEARVSFVSTNIVISTHAATLLSITVTPANSSVSVNGSKQFTATGAYTGGFTDDITDDVTWSSSDSDKASINAGGLATGIEVGIVTITAQLEAISGATSLTIIENNQIPIIENVKQGTFYADEWTASSDNMQMAVSARDATKDAQDQTLDLGLFWKNYAAGQAVADLMRTANIGNHRLDYNDTYTNTVLKDGPVQYLKMEPESNPRVAVAEWWGRYWLRDYRTFTIVDENVYTELEENRTTLDITNFYPNGATTTIAAASNGQALPQGAISVASTAGFPNSGGIMITIAGTPTFVYYQGKTPTEFLNCTGGSGTLATGQAVANAIEFFNAKYETYVTFDYAETYTIEVLVDDGAKVYIDGDLIINAVRVGAEATFSGNYVNPTAGNVVKVEVEHYQHSTPTRLRLRWSSASQALQVVPSGKTQYFHTMVDSASNKPARVFQTGTTRVASLINSDPDGSALQFDGANGYAIIGVDGIPASTSAVTIEFWASASNSSGDARTFYDLRGTYGTYFNVSSPSGSQVMELFLSGAGGNNTYQFTRPAAGTHHYVVQLNKATNPDTLKLWIDGVLQTPTSTTTANNTDYITNANLYLMASNSLSNKINGSMDEFAIYPYLLTPEQIAKHYRVGKADKITVYPLLYAKDQSVWDAALEIATADLGMYTLEEDDTLLYESALEFYSPTPNRHTSVQYTLSDDQEIISGTLPVELQANKVVVKVNPATIQNVDNEVIWIAEDNESLVVTESTATMASNATTLTVQSVNAPLWLKSGYFKIDDEIMQYTGLANNNQFTGITRGLFGTHATSHASGSLVREARVYDVEFQSAPASFVAPNPLIIAKDFEYKVDIDQFTHDAWKAHIVVSASETCEVGELVMLRGTHPITDLIYTFELVGVPVAISQSKESVTEQVASNSDNIRKYRIKDVTVDNKFVQNKTRASEIGQFVLARYQEPVPILEIECMGIPHLQTGDRVKIANFEQFNIEDEEYWVISIEQNYDGGVTMNLKLRKVS